MPVEKSNILPHVRNFLAENLGDNGLIWNTDDTFYKDLPSATDICEYHKDLVEKGITDGHWFLPFVPQAATRTFPTEGDAVLYLFTNYIAKPPLKGFIQTLILNKINNTRN